MPDEIFDVFLSHNSKDKAAVRQIAEKLEGRGLRVWLDERELPPGVPWQDELETIIKTVRSAAVLVGKDGLGPWEIPEIRACLSEMVDRKLRVIPVLLPGAPSAPQLPLFLRQNTWVDLRGGITDEGLDSLQWGITGKKPIRREKPTSPVPPRLHNLPFSSLGDLLKGRDEELRKLQEGTATAITQAQTLYGLGGIGKTRLAVEHAWRSGDRYDTAFFVVVESPEALHSGLANLARPDLLNLPESKAASQKESIAAVLRWLREHDRWLLILDNVDTKDAEQAVVKIVPSLSTGRVLITSRIKDWPASIKRQQIETLSLDEAQRFLLERTENDRSRSDEDPKHALRLAEELGGLPLALEQAGAYISHHQMSLSKYLEELEQERDRMLNWYDGSVMEYPSSVAVTWQKTFQQLSPTAAAILRLTAFLAPDPIPSEMFEEGEVIVEEAVRLLHEETGREAVNSSMTEGIAELASFSMVTRKGENFTVHRMVQDALRSRIPEEKQQDWIEKALRLVNAFSPADPDDVRTWPVWDLLRPHSTRIVGSADTIGIVHPTARQMDRLSILLFAKSLYGEAEPLIRRALALNEASYGPEHSKVSVCLNDLAQLLKATNRLAEAEPLMRRALQIDEDSHGPLHPIVAILLNNLAQLLKATNRLAEAEPLMRRALQIDEDSHGPLHPNVARGLNNLAQLLHATNRLAEAEPLMRRALQIDEDSCGPLHPNVARDLNNLALLLQDTNRLPEAEPLMRRALQIDEDSYGPLHPSVARHLYNLAQLLQVTSRLADAEPLMRRALHIDEDSFGQNHPDVARDLNKLASLLKATDRLAEAEPLMRRALQIGEDSYGPQHPNVARDLNNLASLLQDTDRFAEAEPLLRRALQIDEDSYGPDHPEVAIDLHNLAWLLQRTERMGEAIPMVLRAVEIYERSLGPDHPKSKNAQRTLNMFRKQIAAESEPSSSPEGAQA
ncbi:MAG TPA: tetratricopeptide repeat protein [Thermoanaerobaculia bacterium]|nr:tetratricopeptide repeat protein [Thermoanaerobaculia bacterium]